MTDDEIFESRSLQQYLEQISKFPILTEEEEKELGRKIQQGDKEALRRLVESNLRLWSIMLKNSGMLDERGVSLSDRLPDSDQEVEETIRDEVVPSVEYQIIKSAIEQQVREMLQELDEKEALVLRLRFGLDDNEPRTLQEIGDMLNLTRERIRQIELKAKRKLAQSHKLQQLRGFLN